MIFLNENAAICWLFIPSKHISAESRSGGQKETPSLLKGNIHVAELVDPKCIAVEVTSSPSSSIIKGVGMNTQHPSQGQLLWLHPAHLTFSL